MSATADFWSYFTVPVPAATPADQLEEVAALEFLNKHEDIFVHHTWIQSVGPEVKPETEEADTQCGLFEVEIHFQNWTVDEKPSHARYLKVAS